MIAARFVNAAHSRIEAIIPPGGQLGFLVAGGASMTVSVPVEAGNVIFEALQASGVPVAAYVAPVVTAPAPVTYKRDLWDRATDAEAEMMQAALNSQSVRLRRMFDDAQDLSPSTAEYALLVGALEGMFGEERAAELLAPSV